MTYEEALAKYKKAVDEDTGCWSTMRAREVAAVQLADAAMMAHARRAGKKRSEDNSRS